MMALRRVRAARKWHSIALSLVLIGSAAGVVASAASASAASASSPPLFLITPRGLSFGFVPLGSTTASQEITVKNVSGHPQTMSGSGGGAGVFGGAQNCQSQTLAPGASCQMFYAFSPTSRGTAHGSTNGTWNGQAFSLNFTGTAIPGFLITPTNLSFGNVKVGTTSHEQTINVTNVSNESVVMSGTGGGGGVFGGVQNCQDQTLAAGASCQMFYAFSPTATGTVNSSAGGTWNGQSFSIRFSGTGKP
jgi:hypothetical protein